MTTDFSRLSRRAALQVPRFGAYFACLLTFACSSDETIVGVEPPAGGGNGTSDATDEPVYAFASEIETPEGDVLYLDTTSDLSAPFDPVANGIEIPNASTFKYQGEQVFVGQNDGPTITRYVLDDGGRLEQDRTLSFSGVGVASAQTFTIVSETKAYLYDLDTYVAHVWNPSTMELTGAEIDLTPAFQEEYGPLDIYPWRDRQVLRDGVLFIPGGWWEDIPYQRSLALAIDTRTDELTLLEDERCTFLSSIVRADNGDLYFFPSSYALVNSELPSCALVVRDGETRFDPDYLLDAQAALGGRMVFDAHRGPGNTAYLMVPHEERIEAETRPDVLDNARNDMRFWRMDLATEQATEITSIDWFSRIRFGFDVEAGVRLVNVERLKSDDELAADDYEISPTLYELLGDDEPREFPVDISSDETRARVAEIARLR